MTATGLLITSFGYIVMPMLTTAMITVSAVMTFVQPNAVRPDTGREAAHDRNDLRLLLRNRSWVLLLAHRKHAAA